jgi:hypothetical protein
LGKAQLYQDFQQQYLADPKSGKRPFFEEGQQFIVDRACPKTN